MEQFHAWDRWLTLQGHVVYSVAGPTKRDWEVTDEQRVTLNLVYLAKIEESDAILIIDRPFVPKDVEGGDLRNGLQAVSYIGKGMEREREWARIRGKTVYYVGGECWLALRREWD
jgi:hypothetical protein